MANWDADYVLWGTFTCDICNDYGLYDSEITKVGLIVTCKKCAGKDEDITKLLNEKKKREEERAKKEKIRKDILKCKNSIDTTNIVFTLEEIDKALLDGCSKRVEDHGLVMHKIRLGISVSQAWSKEDFESKSLDAVIEHQIYSGDDDSVGTWVSIYTYRRRLHEWVRSPQLLLDSLKNKKYQLDKLDNKVSLTFGDVSVSSNSKI
ncbi:hypothetical protein NDS46_29955 (plasmid) [Paenibacillus thiaminolyticus]|uniref:hypothetical protein n=1 Tax=Paenibacillus thiaminolyticus TaxID=49283 RepID=UPI0023306EF6|nr:hypothetical protein [Paenibacillus thiaminolyticus]WCF11573.1 hypothetical protein NDS46_29955 [Paenibacillus thiaminolyticus]